MATEHEQFILWNEATQKFDYFMAGLTGAIIAYVGQAFSPQKLGWNSSTLELVALLLLIGAFWCAFKRIETFAEYLGVMLRRNRADDSAIALREASQNKVARDLRTGTSLTREQKASLIEKSIQLADSADTELKAKGAKAMNFYKARNYLLIAGFLLLLVSRVLSAYIYDLY